MGAKIRTPVRRSAAEWAKLVAEWKRSGLDGGTFAASRQVDQRRLAWWRWRLSKVEKDGRARSGALRLVEVDVETAPSEHGGHVVAPRTSWEITTPRGQLVVHERIGPAELGAVLEALFSGRVGS